MDFGYKAYAKMWTDGAIFCYERGCNCNGCFVADIITSQSCLMKNAVLELVRKFGKPYEDTEKIEYSERELKVIELIKQGKDRFDIEKIMNFSYGQTSYYFKKLYAKARKQGLKFKNKDIRRYFDEYKQWLESEG